MMAARQVHNVREGTLMPAFHQFMGSFGPLSYNHQPEAAGINGCGIVVVLPGTRRFTWTMWHGAREERTR